MSKTPYFTRLASKIKTCGTLRKIASVVMVTTHGTQCTLCHAHNESCSWNNIPYKLTFLGQPHVQTQQLHKIKKNLNGRDCSKFITQNKADFVLKMRPKLKCQQQTHKQTKHHHPSLILVVCQQCNKDFLSSMRGPTNQKWPIVYSSSSWLPTATSCTQLSD